MYVLLHMVEVQNNVYIHTKKARAREKNKNISFEGIQHSTLEAKHFYICLVIYIKKKFFIIIIILYKLIWTAHSQRDRPYPAQYRRTCSSTRPFSFASGTHSAQCRFALPQLLPKDDPRRSLLLGRSFSHDQSSAFGGSIPPSKRKPRLSQLCQYQSPDWGSISQEVWGLQSKDRCPWFAEQPLWQ